MIVTRRLVADRLRSLRWWVLGAAGLVLSSTALYPTVKGQASFDDLVKDMPAAIVSLFGMDATIGLSSAPGYLHARLFSALLPLVLVIFAVGLGTRAIAGAEEDGTLELTLARAVTRRRFAVERFVAVAALVIALTAVAAVLIAGSAAAVGALEGVNVAGLLVACAGAGALALLHGALAYAVGGATGRRSLTLGVSTTVAIGGYLLNGLIGVSDGIHALRFVTPWHWYLGRNMLAHGPALDAVVLPIAVSVVFVAIGTFVFERRDLT